MNIDIQQLEGIAFDAYGTLLNIASIDTQLQEQFGDKAPAVAAHWRRKQLEYTWLRTLMGKYKDFYALTKDALTYALEAADVQASPEQRQQLMREYYLLEAYSEVSSAMEELKGKYRLAILSNANPSLLERAAVHNGLDELLDKIISADEVGQYKPVPAVYQLAEKHLELPAAKILFISSNTWDVAGATAFGLQTAWVRRGQGTLEQLGFQPSLIVNDLTELANLLA